MAIFVCTLQNMSLQFIEKALNFLNTQRTYVSNITETLLTIAALIVDKASESAKHSPVPKNETQEQDKENAKVNIDFILYRLKKGNLAHRLTGLSQAYLFIKLRYTESHRLYC